MLFKNAFHLEKDSDLNGGTLHISQIASRSLRGSYMYRYILLSKQYKANNSFVTDDGLIVNTSSKLIYTAVVGKNTRSKLLHLDVKALVDYRH